MVSKTARNHALGNDTNESSLEDFLSLLKPRVMSLAIFTSVCGLLLAPNQIHPFLIFVAILCISIGAGASGAINMWYDQDIDGLMVRTKGRPIPQGKISALDALGFGTILAIISVLVLGLAVNYFAAFLLFFSIFFYIFIYTIWLKRRTPQNIVIGGAAGAFPPVIGWACSTGDISVFPLILFLIIFMWTPPHFWALALYKDIEYSKAKVPMLPVVKGKKITKMQIMIYSMILFAVTTLPFLLEFSGLIYIIAASILNTYFCYLSFRLLKSSDNDELSYAPKLFKFSILYLYCIFSFLVIDMAL
ncbi:MAG: protoheme IX farnesyltransferase [Rickettsiales bacterium]|nr:protoheme IX farnesyltransferase [Rickettsiales bacterium]OUT46359.1 MAG: protoheme IX farnesyltransferase [Pelagibacteraceae bacterium TMED13]